jgi:hypothetical protein
MVRREAQELLVPRALQVQLVQRVQLVPKERLQQ